MGTNYYLETDVCSHCGRSDERLHIGKSSGGWCFSLHVIPERGILDLPDWEREWSKPGARIVDEYGNAVPAKVMIEHITERSNVDSWDKKPPLDPEYGYASWADFHAKNHSEEGPRGLLRHRAGDMGVKPGAGTYDLCPYEFS